MKVSIIRPNMNELQSSDAMEPVIFAVLAALTPADVDLRFFDERIEKLTLTDKPDLVAMSVETHTARRAYQIASHYRQVGIPVVMGGYHPALLPEEALQFADAVVIGDAEENWLQVLRDAKAGSLQAVYQQPYSPKLESRRGDYSIFKNKNYSLIKPIQAGRGCKFSCDFCSINAFYGKSVRQRPLQDVVAEIKGLNAKYIFLVDDNLFTNRDQTIALLHALISLKIRWACQTSLDIANDSELMDLLAKSGCFSATIGFESLHTDNLRQMKKSSNLQYDDFAPAIAELHNRGIMIYGTFVFGYDSDTVDSFAPVVEFAIKSKFCLANFNPLTPTPGTALYKRLEKQNRLIYKHWWIDPAYRYGQATFHPVGMTAEELTAGCFQARKAFNTAASIFSRAFNRKANSRNISQFGLYLLANFVSKKEIYAKQGARFGAPGPSLATDNIECN